MDSIHRALAEIGRVHKTVHILKTLDDEVYRRRMGRELNKGEASHDLSRFLCFGKEGALHGREFGDQIHTFSCLSVLHNAVIAWNTLHIGPVVERAAELATHFEQGGEYTKAVRYLKHAAEKALQRYAYQEAIGLLRRGLAVLPKLPETPCRSTCELDLQIALGQVLTVTQGPGTPAVAHAYARAEELCQQVGEIRQRIAVLRGLRRATQGRGEPTRAQPLAEEFLRLAHQAQDTALLIEGHVALGVCLFFLAT